MMTDKIRTVGELRSQPMEGVRCQVILDRASLDRLRVLALTYQTSASELIRLAISRMISDIDEPKPTPKKKALSHM